MESFFGEGWTVKSIVDPVDWNTAAVSGGRIDMQNLERVALVVVLNSATSRTAVTMDIDQHTVASSGSPAALSIANKYFHKIGAATKFTAVDPNSAADSYDLTSLVGDSKAIVIFEVLASDLSDGYRWISVNTADSGAAGIGTIIALGKAKFKPAAVGLAV